MLSIRRVEEAELPTLEELCVQFGFQIGVENRKILSETTKCFSYFIVTGEGEIVGFRVAHLAAPDICHKYLAYLDPKYQGRGDFSKVEQLVDDDLKKNGWLGTLSISILQSMTLEKAVSFWLVK